METKIPKTGRDVRGDDGYNGGGGDDSSPEALQRQFDAPAVIGRDGARRMQEDLGGAADRRDLKAQEESAAGGSAGKIDDKEKSFASGGGFFRDEGPSRASKIKGRITNFSRRRIAIIAVTGLVGGGGIFGVSILSGPFQTIHLAQTLQEHFKSNEDFGNDRTSKVLIYALAGKGAQNGRLGVPGNFAANKWEKRLIKETGMRPLYSDPGRRMVGFQIVDSSKAENIIGDIREQDSRRSQKLQQAMGEGSYTRKQKSGERFYSSDGPMDADSDFVDITQQNSGQRRVWVKTVGDATNVNRVSSTIGSRLLIKRGGISFHTMNKLKDRADRKASANRQERRQKAEEERKQSIQNGIVEGEAGAANSEDKDGDGDKETNPDDQKISDDSKKIIDEFKGGALKSTASAAAVVGILCAAKSYGEGVEDFKFQNNVMPMMRLGMDAVSKGSQVMSGDDFDLEVLGDYSRYLYDEKTKTSWASAESVRAEQGKSGGVPVNPEARLANASDKPDLFKMIDAVPGLGGACSALDTVLGLPIIKELGGAVAAVTGAAANAALAPFGTNTNELMMSSLKTIAGKSVDPLAEGAEFGNLANTGTFLAANDQAISTGGRALSGEERTELANLEKIEADRIQSEKSLIVRYFDPYDSSSAASALIDSSPASPSQAADMAKKPLENIGSIFSIAFSAFAPKVNAASNGYDYGVPKYGFSVAEQSDSKFENPYDNALTVEKDLENLNKKYGNKCFGMTVGGDDSTGVTIQSADKAVNPFKVAKEDDCNPAKNGDAELFTRYRMYLADAVTAISLACYEGDTAACGQVGMGASASSDSAPASTAGAKVDVANIREPSENIDCAVGTKDLGIQDGYTQGKKLRIRLCAIPGIKSTGQESNGGYGVTGGDGNAVVNSRVSGAFYALAQAAKSDGIDVSAISSFRSMSHQQELCQRDIGGCAFGNYKFVAKPGTSNHQLGVAIDFSHEGRGGSADNCDGGSDPCTLKGDKTWEWLTDNAGKFGMKQYSAEFWHWSPLED